MESSSLATLKPLSFLTCGFEYRQLNEGSDTGYEEYYFKIPGSIIINDSMIIDESSWVEVVLTYEAYVSDSPFCETEDNFYSELQEIYLRAITKRKRETYINAYTGEIGPPVPDEIGLYNGGSLLYSYIKFNNY